MSNPATWEWAWESSKRWHKLLGSCHPSGRPGWNSRLLGMSWNSPGHRPSGKWANRGKSYLSVFLLFLFLTQRWLSVTLPFVGNNKDFKNRKKNFAHEYFAQMRFFLKYASEIPQSENPGMTFSNEMFNWTACFAYSLFLKGKRNLKLKNWKFSATLNRKVMKTHV